MQQDAPPDAPEPNGKTDWAAVERDYRTGKYTNRQIAEVHGCSHTQVGRRATQYGWTKPGESPKEPKAKAPQRTKDRAPERTSDAPATHQEERTSEVASALARQGATESGRPLNHIEEAFVTEYLRNGMNGTAAWMAIHPGANPDYAHVYAGRLVRKRSVADRIDSERQRVAKLHQMTRNDLLNEFLAIVRADPNELTQMRAVACSACWPDQPRRGRWTEPDADCPECQGEGNAVPWIADTRKLSHEARALFAGIQITKDGVKVLMHDKHAALVSIARILGAFEKDNAQKRPELSEALSAFVAQIHDEGAGRLKFAPRPTAPAPRVEH